MKLFYWVIFIFPFHANALIGLENLQYIQGNELFNYNLLDRDSQTSITNISNKTKRKKSTSDSEKLQSAELVKIRDYQKLYNEAEKLKLTCDYRSDYRYANMRQEANARRSVVSTLQYLGLDISLKAIVKYSKLLDLSKDEFDNIVENLLQNNCSQNISVFSIKLLRKKFYYYYHNEDAADFKLPSVKDNQFFAANFQRLTNSIQAKKKEFNLTLKNFRAFCSWGGDTDDYRLLAPYVANPYIMSFVYDHLKQKKIRPKKKEAVRVACDDLLCRRHEKRKFQKLFPRMIGSTDLYADLENLYCGHFRHQTYVTKGNVQQVNEWVKDQSLEDPYLETFQFIALYTGVPDLLIATDKYQQIGQEVLKAINNDWDQWAKSKSDQFVSDLLYEGPLQIDLMSKAVSDQVRQGDFNFELKYTLGELDRVLNLTDKIQATMYLEFPRSYLRWLRSAYLKANNLSRYAKKEALEQKASLYFASQLEQKSQIFLIPMWSENLPKMLAKELIAQLSNYNGSRLDELGHDLVKIPVKLRYGLFALKYLRKRFKEKYRSSSLTYGH